MTSNHPLRVLTVAVAALAALPAAARADDLHISYTPLQPVVGQPMQFKADAHDPFPEAQQIDVFIRANSDGTCGETAAQEAAAGTTHIFSESLAPSTASADPQVFRVTFTPVATGDYTYCGYDNFTAHPDQRAENSGEFVVTRGSSADPPAASCVVPKLTGKRLAAAKRALAGAHCGVGSVSKSRGGRSARGRVVSQSPRAGAKLKAGTKVRLVVGR